MRTRSGKEGTNARARALAFVYDRVRCEQGKQVSRQAAGRQRTRNYRRGYIPALSLPSRAVVTSRPRPPTPRIRVMTFSTAALKIAPRPFPLATSSRL